MTYPTREQIGAKIEQLADEGAISEIGLLRLCKIVSALSLINIDEEAIVGGLMLIYPQATSAIYQAARDLQSDSMLAVRPPKTKKGDEDNG